MPHEGALENGPSCRLRARWRVTVRKEECRRSVKVLLSYALPLALVEQSFVLGALASSELSTSDVDPTDRELPYICLTRFHARLLQNWSRCATIHILETMSIKLRNDIGNDTQIGNSFGWN